MNNFNAARARLTDATFATFGSPDALLYAGGTGDGVTIRARLVRAVVEESFGQASLGRPRDTVQIPYADAPALKDGDHVLVDGARYRIAGKPLRPGLGPRWEATLIEVAA